MRIVWAVILLGAMSLSSPTDTAAPVTPATSDPRPITITLARTVANAEFLRSNLYAAPPRGTPHLPAMAGTPWFGEIVRRLPEDVATLRLDHFVPFVAEYVDGRPRRAWCDTNLDGGLADAPPIALSTYSPIEGARSFLAHLGWTVPGTDRPIAVDTTIRVVLEPATGPDQATPPQFRLQSVFAMTGTVTLEGKPHLAFLLDGDGDGLYTRGLLDGLFIDVDDDGHFLVDPMGPEFASLRMPFSFGSTSYEVVALDPEGRRVVMAPRGAGAPTPAAPRLGAAAPDFSFTAIDGREMRLSSLRGRPVLVYFWGSFCRTCAEQADDLRRLYEKSRGAGLEILGISYDTDRAAMDGFRKLHGQAWPTSFSGHQLWEDPVGRLYRERGTGVFYLVDPDGVLVEKTSNLASIESALRPLLPR